MYIFIFGEVPTWVRTCYVTQGESKCSARVVATLYCSGSSSDLADWHLQKSMKGSPALRQAHLTLPHLRQLQITVITGAKISSPFSKP